MGAARAIATGMFFYLAAVGPFLFLLAPAFVLGRASAVSATESVARAHHHPVGAMAKENSDATSHAGGRSNATHIGWIHDDGTSSRQLLDAARAEMTDYLWENIMPYDVPNACTLGFDPRGALPSPAASARKDNESKQTTPSIPREMREQATVDGLSDGILNQTLYYSLRAKTLYPWTDAIPRSVYMEYAVPYAVVNEPRSDHRPLLFNTLRDTLNDYKRTSGREGRTTTPEQEIKQVVKLVNTRLWSLLGRTPSTPVIFQAGLTPRIYDPLSVLAYGHSSCTGLAILLVAALRAVGIPARMAGTPAWHDEAKDGNHSWVEVFVPGDGNGGGRWVFLEPSPGIAEGDEEGHADDLDRDPCKRWFCKAARFDGATKVFATRYDRKNSDAHYPMAWAVGEEGVPGEDRSEYYTNVCGKCD